MTEINGDGDDDDNREPVYAATERQPDSQYVSFVSLLGNMLVKGSSAFNLGKTGCYDEKIRAILAFEIQVSVLLYGWTGFTIENRLLRHFGFFRL